MITLEEAKNLQRGDVLCQLNQKGSDGCHVRWRVNGIPLVWKTRPNEVRVPLKHGLRSYDYLTQFNLDELTLSRKCECGNR